MPAGARAALARAAAGDADPVVALAAAGALCGDAAAADPAPVLAALGAPGMARARALAGAPPRGGSPAALLDVARCLAADARRRAGPRCAR